jgi:hypothetical protein
MVSYEGCCSNGDSACCCGIADAGGDVCVSAPDSFQQWGRSVNGCERAELVPSYTGA